MPALFWVLAACWLVFCTASTLLILLVAERLADDLKSSTTNINTDKD